MIYVNQLENAHVMYACNVANDTPDKGFLHHSTLDRTGCGICSALMVADRLRVDPDFSMKDALQISYDTGANHAAGTDYKLYGPAFAEKFDLKFMDIVVVPASFGEYEIVNNKPGTWTTVHKTLLKR